MTHALSQQHNSVRGVVRRGLRGVARWGLALLLLLGLLLAVVLAVVVALQRRIVFPRHLVRPAPAAGQGLVGLQRLWLQGDAGAVEAWLLPGEGVSPAHPGPAVIFAHGNAELIDDWPQRLEPYRQRGITVLLPEYRGYGRSAGRPSEAAIAADFRGFYDRLAARPEVDARRIVLHGRSLGGGVVCALAAQRPAAALILMSTFTSVRTMARAFGLPGFAVLDPFDNLAVVRRFPGPTLLVHGRRDRVIPVRHGQELQRAARHGRLVLYPDADHNDCPPDWATFWPEVWSLLRGAGVLRE